MRELLTRRLATALFVSWVSLFLAIGTADAQTTSGATGWRPSRPARTSRPATPSATKLDPFTLPSAAPVRQASHDDVLGDVVLGPGEILVSPPAYEPLPPGAVIQDSTPGPRRRFVPGPPMVGPGDYIGYDDGRDPFLDGFAEGCCDSDCNTAPGDCNGCNSCAPDGCCDNWIEPNCRETSFDACAPCMQWCWAQDLTFFGGVEGFKGPMDQGTNGNFGYHVGGNYAFPLWCRFGLGLQTGFQVNATNLSGSPQAAIDGTGEQRTQVFATAGLFRRTENEVWGWNAGVAYDYLSDDYFDTFMYSQIRAEVSRRFRCRHEIGFLGAFGVRNDNFIDPETDIDTATTVLDQYLGFYRHRFERGGEGRILAGVSGNSDAILGADAIVPFSDRFALETSGVYVIPGEGTDGMGATQEVWNIQTSIVWYPGRTGLVSTDSRYRPLFGVANAGSLITIR